MKNWRLVLCAALALAAAGTWVTGASACDKSKARTTTADAKASCPAHAGDHATTASAHSGCEAHAAKATSATAAACCAAKGAKSASATTASATKGKVDAVATGGGASCQSHKGATASHDCDACEDLALCGPDGLLQDGASIQTVALKNGVMFVYTGARPGHANAIQSAMQRRSERITKLVATGDKATLCPQCKDLRGAMASGKLAREVVNIEGGTLVLMTSNDAAMVKKIRAMAEAAKAPSQTKI